MKIGFGDDMSQSDQQHLFEQLIDFRHRHKISLGLTYSHESIQAGLSESMAGELVQMKPNRVTHSHASEVRNRSETTTRAKLLSALSQSPCCQEYRRTGLGSLSVVTTKKLGPWRLSDINVQYDHCTR